MALLRDEQALGPLFGAAAARLGILPGAVEKDYWITQALRALAREYGREFIFKGGTSLSKAYGLIQRFSEDIDILVPVEAGLSESTIDRRLKKMGAAAATGCGPDAQQRLRSGRGEHRTDALWYGSPQTELDPKRPQPMLPYIQLELGIHGGIQPHAHCEIGTLVGVLLRDEQDIALESYEDLALFEAPVLDPARTLIEKLILLNTAAQESKENPSAVVGYRVGRHYYDLYCLLDDEDVCNTLGNRGQFSTILGDATEISSAHYGGAAARPRRGFAASAAFKGSRELMAVIESQYEEAMDAFYFGPAPHPTFADVLARVEAQAGLL